MKAKEVGVSQVEFPAPIVDKLPSQKPVPVPSEVKKSYMDNLDFFKQALMQARIEGFDEGAIVVSKYASMPPRCRCANWGVVVSLKPWAVSKQEFKPIVVKWCADNRPEDEYSMDDLLLIHPAISYQELVERFDKQDDPMPDIQC